MNASDLIKKYIAFFESKQHTRIPSASLVPQNDATVLFTTAGMQPLAPFFLGEKHPIGARLVNVQKCLRTVDFENIGDNTHNTFFQMLGNWSLGDYFKNESIEWSFEFLTSKKWLNLPVHKLSFTVFEGDKFVGKDTEAAEKWESLGVPKEKITYLGEDNFWSAGDVGPCGPSSEIFYWTGDEEPTTQKPDEDERWVEIWNNVFMTFEKKADGSCIPLPQKNIDTGMGLERTLTVLTGKKSAYETDLFMPCIKKIEELSQKSYADHTTEMRIIADHMRAAVFLLGDENQTVPSNVDQGYILRRFIRKSIRQLTLLNIPTGSLSTLAQIFIDSYKEMYPELGNNQKTIITELEKEENKFSSALEKGTIEFNRVASKLKEHGGTSISGKVAFLLFQSYGFPIEMTQDMATEVGLTIDMKGFDKEQQKHIDASKKGSDQKFKGGLADDDERTVRLHTATHLLNEALRKVVSKDIVQKGSNITSERLRFDFNFDRKLTPEEVKAVEDEVNAVVAKEMAIERSTMSPNEAKKLGAQSEFGMKYPDAVSVYKISDYSLEICMGPHVKNTKEVGKFKIKKEESSAAGVRRIKATVE
ncbi:MAG: alanyl-tRNA synthetase [Candidatus Woesearchaeota archaeon]|jgi:alanyl-tRNA synthetase